MNRKIFCLLGYLLAINLSYCQLINDGGIIVIGSGSLISVNNNFENKNGGIVTNDGKLEVKGNFLNSSVYSSTTSDDSLLITGNSGSAITMSSSFLTNLWINKASAAIPVTLLSNLTVAGRLNFEQGAFNTLAYVLSSPVTTTFEFGTGKEIAGNVKRTGWINNNTVVFNQPNMLIQTTGGVAPTDFTVNMVPGGNPTDNEKEVSREFRFSHSGGNGFNTNARYPYQDSELNINTENNLVPWFRSLVPAAEWNAKNNAVIRDIGTNYVSITNISTSELPNEWKLADPNYLFNTNAFLRGAWGTTSMNNSLTGILPVNQPYSAAPFSYSGNESVSAGFFATHPNIVDWILVQFRKPSSGLAVNATEATAVGTKAAFVLQDGTIVDVDGVSPLSMSLSKQGSGFLVIRHRNHIAAMSNAISANGSGIFSNDFRILSNSYTNPNPGITNLPQALLPGSSSYGLWPGNANADVSVDGNDLTLVRQRANLSVTGYESADVNLDGGVNGSDLFLTRKISLGTVQTHSSRVTVNGQNLIIQSHIPH